MTAPLPIPEPCGCPIGEGHRCPPPWVDEWPDLGTDNGFRADDRVESGGKGGPRGAGNTTEGLAQPSPDSTREGGASDMLVTPEAAPPEIGGN